jgi:hypothetical protein
MTWLDKMGHLLNKESQLLMDSVREKAIRKTKVPFAGSIEIEPKLKAIAIFVCGVIVTPKHHFSYFSGFLSIWLF